MRFICKNCRYRFESSMDYKKKSCPYCGEKSVGLEPDADDLLKEID
ncbi:MAG: hypothetical protein Q7R52_02200 [archaeon]|nr:hypothetical protein [archaeon]